MKTTKKGFTLIELIVVIAIIGVLAAILVPAMLGYVKKSKIQSANSAASTILKACNSALAELDEIDAGFTGTEVVNGSATTVTAGTSTDEQADVIDYMSSYFDDANLANYSIAVENNVAIYCCAKSGSYWGTCPAAYTAKSYPDKCDRKTALAAAEKVYNTKHGVNSNSNNNNGGNGGGNDGGNVST